MEKKEIQTGLVRSYTSFTDYLSSLNEEEYMRAPEGKWTAGQQLDHLIRAVDPLAKGLLLPKFLVKLFFGKANRPSRSYEELVKKYKSKLEAGGKAAGRFIPSSIAFSDKERNAEKLLKKIGKLNNSINGYSETQLDTFILPHPLLGKITIREMMYFTIYHAEHHEGLVKKYSTASTE